jgi:hypothetical protein
MRARTVLFVVAALVAAGGLVLLGRATSGSHTGGYQTGRSDGYFDGLRVGEARGRQEGRALAEEASVPAAARPSVRDAFNSGYTAGLNDAFAGYDGGWALSTPYVVALEAGTAPIVYRISSRTLFEKGVNYYLCPDGHALCQEPRR